MRQRIIEYLGGDKLEDATCLFLGRLDPLNPSRFERQAPEQLHSLLDESCELARSLEDRAHMLIHLDIEYVNFDDPAAAYLDPQRVFRLQEPLVEVIESRLLALGIHYLHIVTGQGHHFVWKIREMLPDRQGHHAAGDLHHARSDARAGSALPPYRADDGIPRPPHQTRGRGGLRHPGGNHRPTRRPRPFRCPRNALDRHLGIRRSPGKPDDPPPLHRLPQTVDFRIDRPARHQQSGAGVFRAAIA